MDICIVYRNRFSNCFSNPTGPISLVLPEAVNAPPVTASCVLDSRKAHQRQPGAHRLSHSEVDRRFPLLTNWVGSCSNDNRPSTRLTAPGVGSRRYGSARNETAYENPGTLETRQASVASKHLFRSVVAGSCQCNIDNSSNVNNILTYVGFVHAGWPTASSPT
jgi:hypothetical protein